MPWGRRVRQEIIAQVQRSLSQTLAREFVGSNPALSYFGYTYFAHLKEQNFVQKFISMMICGQSYKQFTLINYDSRVVPDLKTPHITTLGS